MAARSSWKGFLKLSLVSVPVKAYTATSSGGGEVRLNQLHGECHSRINYKKTCPIHGEVPNDQIVSGYEYSKGQYVVIDPEDIEKLRSADEKAINIDVFVPDDALDPAQFSGKSYYLVPDGPVGQKPYALLAQGMAELKRNAVARVVMHGRSQLVMIRPMDGVLNMSILNYDSQVTKPAAFEEEVTKPQLEGEELKLAKTLIEASTPKDFDLSQYKDDYTDKLTELINKKVAGEEVVAPPVHEQAQIINLMDALKGSLEKVQKGQPEAEAAAKPPKKMAPSVRKQAKGAKRKSG
jgi:DNA end-binding protein Ku